jgi:hypothetical protein
MLPGLTLVAGEQGREQWLEIGRRRNAKWWLRLCM